MSLAEPDGYDQVRTIVCDLDGVLYVDSEPVPGAGEALERLQSDGYDLLFVTNNATRTPAMVVANIAQRTGFVTTADRVVTSPQAVAHYLKANHLDDCFVIGEDGLRETLRYSGLRLVEDWREAKTVVTGLDRSVTYRRFADATLAIRHGAEFICTNLDPTYPTPAGLQPGGGAIAALVEVAAGVTPVSCGKPAAPIRDLIASRLAPGQVVVVGDRMDTDIAMATAQGWFGALVLSGSTDASSAPAPTPRMLVLDSIADLPGELRRRCAI